MLPENGWTHGAISLHWGNWLLHGRSTCFFGGAFVLHVDVMVVKSVTCSEVLWYDGDLSCGEWGRDKFGSQDGVSLSSMRAFVFVDYVLCSC